VLGVLFFLALLGGFVITLVLVGTVGGFNLMYPTIAVEGSDSFDAISRSFSYVYARPWRMLFYTAIAILYGALTYLFVRHFIWLMLALTHFFVGWWLGGKSAMYWHGLNDLGVAIWPTPRSPGALTYTPDYEHLKWSEATAATFIWLWVYLLLGLMAGFVISFYFSANSIIYYLMRREVDATDVDEVYLEESEEDFTEAPPGEAADKVAPPVITTTTTVIEEVRTDTSTPVPPPEGPPQA
jgi:hypothetical protein